MKVGIKTQSAERPVEIGINELVPGVYDLHANFDIQEVTIVREERNEKAFEYLEYRDTKTLSGYEEAVSALVALRYSYGDEIALMRKGGADSTNEEYVEYLAWVEKCKVYARAYFGVN